MVNSSSMTVLVIRLNHMIFNHFNLVHMTLSSECT